MTTRLASSHTVRDVEATIEARELTKRYGSTAAVDDLSFRVEPGKVTGFVGPTCVPRNSGGLEI